ncbi:MAG: InlB B-repeat-containing protein, partial [Alphaproteobacteria bacterium]|nr:InlB B-repeat-containing protein [Alphaproteobacteria bacterium]
MSRFLRFCALLSVLFFSTNLFAAGYTCPTTKNYTSCSAGYYRVKSGSYYTCTACPSGYTSAGGSTVYTAASGACYIQTTAGKYIATANSTTQTTCPAGKYCPSTKVYYGSTGGIYDCPAASGSAIDTFAQMSTWPATAFPDATSSNTTITASLSSWKTGITSKANCIANYVLKWNNGGTDLRKDSVPYNESLGRYATMVSGVEKGDRYIVKLSPGYYLTDCYSSTYCDTTTRPKYYKRAVACPAGSYCPGYTSMPLCSDTSHTYCNDMGKYACPTNWTSAAKATAQTSCYRTITLNKNGGTGTVNGTTGTTAASKTCYYNTSCSFPSASGLSQTGYTFTGGWGTTSSCSASTTSFTITSTASSVTYYACKSLVKPTITLNGNGATSNGTTSIYSTYNTNVYLDSARSKAMTTSANAITKPSRSYTVTYNASNGTVSPTSATATRTFNGFWSATSGGTQYIASTGYITSAGLTAGKGYTTNKTWYAQWTGGAITLATPTRAGYVFNGWYTAASGGTKVGAAGASYTPTSNITLYAQWTQASCDKGTGVASATPTVSNNTVSCAVTCSTGYSKNGGTDTTATFTKVGSAGVATVSTICEPREFTITLNGNGATTNSSPTSLYTVYGMNVYLDSARSKAMTTSANPITIPSRSYTVTYNANGGSVSTSSATATYTFNGYYSAKDSGGTQYIGETVVDTTNAYITSSGITAAKTSTGSTWYARWSGGSVTLPTPTRVGCKFNGWSTSSSATSGTTGSYTPTSSVTLYATWTCMSVSASAKSLTYNGTTTTNGTAQSCANVTVSAPTSGASITYSTSSGGTYSATAPTLTNAGSTTVYYKVDASGYSTYTGSYTCSMATKAMTVSASTKTLTYSGSAQSCANVSVSVPSSGASITYSTSSSGTYSSTAPTLTNAGSTTVYYKVTGSNFTTKTGSYTCTMDKASGTTTLNPSSSTLTYPTTSGSFTATCSGGATPTIALDSTTYASATISSGTVSTTWKAADGTTKITVTCPATTNY